MITGYLTCLSPRAEKTTLSKKFLKQIKFNVIRKKSPIPYKQVIDDKISEFAKTTFEPITESYHITLVEWNHSENHVHIMFKIQPKTELTGMAMKLSKLINGFLPAKSVQNVVIKMVRKLSKSENGLVLFVMTEI